MKIPSLADLAKKLEADCSSPRILNFCQALQLLHEAALDLAVREVSAQVNPLVMQTRIAVYRSIVQEKAPTLENGAARRPDHEV